MICEERLLQVLCSPHISEKASINMDKYNTFILKVAKDATKIEIKTAIQKLFKVEVNCVRTLIVKGKAKRHKHRINYRSNWKKAYITLKKGQNINFMDSKE